MDPIERLLTKITGGLLKIGALTRTESGFVINFPVSTVISIVIESLFKLLSYAAMRIIRAIRERSSEEGIPGIIYREIVAMGSESFDWVVEAVMAVIAFLKKLYNRGAEFTERLGRRSLDSSSGFYSKQK